MKRFIKVWPLVALMMAAVAMLALAGCGKTLEPGGAYAPATTNADGTLVATQKADMALFVADSSYKLAYDAVDAVFKFERNNRAQLATISPKIKLTLDQYRATAVDIDRRWALARQAYKANSIPANLSTLQDVLAEVQRLVPVVQSQLTPAIARAATVPTPPLPN